MTLRWAADVTSVTFSQQTPQVSPALNAIPQVAIKLMERGSKITKYVERELINHSHLLHPHIVQVCSPCSCLSPSTHGGWAIFVTIV